MNKSSIQFPTIEDLAGVFCRNHKDIRRRLLRWGDAETVDDALQEAAEKIMYRKKPEDYRRMPETEEEWCAAIYWQARGRMSALNASEKTRRRHNEEIVASEIALGQRRSMGSFCNIDRDVAFNAAIATLFEICDEAGMKRSNVESAVEWWLRGGSAADIEKSTGIKAGNLYVILHRVKKLLKEKGAERFYELRRKMFTAA